MRARFEREAGQWRRSSIRTSSGCTTSAKHHGAHFLVMPLLDGQTLADRLEQGSSLPIAQVLTIAQ